VRPKPDCACEITIVEGKRVAILDDNGDQLEREAEILLTYILGHPPNAALKERYRRATYAQPGTGTLELHYLAQRWPALLRFFEPFGKARTAHQVELRRRLNLAMTLLETSSMGVGRVRRHPGACRSEVTLRFIGSLAVDILSLPIRLLCTIMGR
jgi:hypothetical protein